VLLNAKEGLSEESGLLANQMVSWKKYAEEIAQYEPAIERRTGRRIVLEGEE
jgi:hypothetical protein